MKECKWIPGLSSLGLLVLILNGAMLFAAPNSVELIRTIVTSEEKTALETVNQLSYYTLDSLYQWLSDFNDYEEPEKMGVIALERQISDTLSAPYYYLIPDSYNPKTPTTLVVWLHGGVSRPEFPEEAGEEILQHPIGQVCKQNGWLLLFPLAKIGCLWWDSTGMEHIDWLIRDAKRRFNIDDDRVVLTGFSDGGSGSFHFAMLNPNDFSILYPLSGCISVGAWAGGMQDYITNLVNRELFVTNGGNDGLYPAAKWLPVMMMAVDNGAMLNFTAYDTAGHNYGYLDEEFPFLVERISQASRPALSPVKYWETSDLAFNHIDWLEITELDTSLSNAVWHQELNYQMTDDRITIGFMADRQWEGEGVRIESVSDDSTSPANQMKMQAGDILIGMQGLEIKSFEDLTEAKSLVKRGKVATFTLVRQNDTLDFSAEFPPPQKYDIFNYQDPSGAIRATRCGNTFDVQTSRIKSFRIYLHPEMVRLVQTVVVQVNGDIKFSGLPVVNKEFMLKNFVSNRDRRLLWVGYIDVIL